MFFKVISFCITNFKERGCSVDSRKNFSKKIMSITLSFALLLGGVVTAQSGARAASASDGSIIGIQVATAQQMAAYALSVNPSPKISCTMLELAKMYLEEGAAEGVRGDIAFAQACNETGTFAYGGTALSTWNNYSGLGVTGVTYNAATASEVAFTAGVTVIKDTQGNSVGVKFSEPRLGVRAQIQHLKGYATTAALKQTVVDPRYSLVSKGIAPGWLDLNGIWAVPGTTYGQQILAIYDKILTFDPGPAEPVASPAAAATSPGAAAASPSAETAPAAASKVLTAIEVTPPSKRSYTVGQKLDLTGLAVTGKYSDGTSSKLDAAKAVISGFDSKAAGSQTVTVAAEGKTATFSVEVVPAIDIIAGKDSNSTAVEVSKTTSTSADTVILASGTDFEDALSAGPLAVQEEAPILLTETHSVPQATQEEIKRLKAKKVIIMGGEEVVGKEVAKALTSLGVEVERISGSSRFSTAMETADRVMEKSGVVDKIVLVNGSGVTSAASPLVSAPKESDLSLLLQEKAGLIKNVPAEAKCSEGMLSVGSYASKKGIPILLTDSNKLPDETKAALIMFGTREVQIAGGYSEVSQRVEDELKALGITVKRISGSSQFGTSAEAAGKLFPDSREAVALNSSVAADALAAIPLAAKKDAPVILVGQGKIPEEVSSYLASSGIDSITVVGGDIEAGQAVKKQLADLLK